MKKIMMTLCTLLAVNAGSTMYAPPVHEVETKSRTETTGPEGAKQGETGRQPVPKDVKENAAKSSNNQSKGIPENKPAADNSGNSTTNTGSIDLSSSKEKNQLSKDELWQAKQAPVKNAAVDALGLDIDIESDKDSVVTDGKRTYVQKDGETYRVKHNESGEVVETSIARKSENGRQVYDEYDSANFDRDGKPTEAYQKTLDDQKQERQADHDKRLADIDKRQAERQADYDNRIADGSKSKSKAKAKEKAQELAKDPTEIPEFVEEIAPESATPEQKATIVERLTSALSKGIESFTKAIADFSQDPMGTISRLTSTPVTVTSPEMRTNKGLVDKPITYGDEPSLFTDSSTGSLKPEDITRPSTFIKNTSKPITSMGAKGYIMPKP